MTGLTEEQVKERIEAGQTNADENPNTRTYKQIVKENTLTFFNFLNLVLLVLVLMVGSFKNAFFVCIIIINTLIGIAQEIRAKKTIDKLAILTAKKSIVLREGKKWTVPTEELVLDDIVCLKTGDQVPADARILEGNLEVNESLLTGEADNLPKNPGDELFSGSFVTSGEASCQIIHVGKDNYASQITSEAKEFKRHNSELRNSLNIILKVISIIIVPIGAMLFYKQYYMVGDSFRDSIVSMVAGVLGMIPEGLVLLTSVALTLGALVLANKKTLVQELYCIETLARVDTLCLDKTGTITFGNRMANEFLPAPGVDDLQLAEAAQLASLSDETPEGRSIVVLAKKQFGIRGRHMDADHISFVPFSASTRMSGVDIAEHDGQPAVSIRKGAAESVAQWVKDQGGTFPQEVEMTVQNVARAGGTPLVVARGRDVLGVIYLKDIVKGGIKERFARLRAMGIRTVMVTGDNALTAASIAAEAGVDDFMAEATPEMKLARIREEQVAGRLVAMTGDGTNDAPALAQADVGVAMNTGTQAAREAGNMVDLDSNPTKLIEIVEIGKQMLITRGALTTFSFANDVAKYFAIIPAMFAGLFVADGMASGPLSALNIMGLNSPQSAILSTVIFNALVIVALIPLALKGVSYRPAGAASLLKRNILIYGVGGLIAPFMGIKLIDMVINAWRLV